MCFHSQGDFSVRGFSYTSAIMFFQLCLKISKQLQPAGPGWLVSSHIYIGNVGIWSTSEEKKFQPITLSVCQNLKAYKSNRGNSRLS